jgi:hypothetical protein
MAGDQTFVIKKIQQKFDSFGFPPNDPTYIALQQMFKSFGFSVDEIPNLVERTGIFEPWDYELSRVSYEYYDINILWESMAREFGSSRVEPFRPPETYGVYHTPQPSTVIKRVNWSGLQLNARDQCEIQRFASEHLNPENGFNILCAPHAWECSLLSPLIPKTELYYEERSCFQFEMGKIDVSSPLTTIPPEVAAECAAFTKLLKAQHIILRDYELYRQPDGRIAMISFGRCIIESESRDSSNYSFFTLKN